MVYVAPRCTGTGVLFMNLMISLRLQRLRFVITVAIIVGAVTISIVILFNNCSGRCHSAALQLLNDPETMASVEESLDLTFVTAVDYDSKRNEIDHVREHGASGDEAFRRISRRSEKTLEELVSARAEYESLRGHSLLGLDKFCGTCSWGNRMTCDQRVLFLRENYKTKLIEAKINAMGRPSCIRQ